MKPGLYDDLVTQNLISKVFGIASTGLTMLRCPPKFMLYQEPAIRIMHI